MFMSTSNDPYLQEPKKLKCRDCGMVFEQGKAYGYVCPRSYNGCCQTLVPLDEKDDALYTRDRSIIDKIKNMEPSPIQELANKLTSPSTVEDRLDKIEVQLKLILEYLRKN